MTTKSSSLNKVFADLPVTIFEAMFEGGDVTAETVQAALCVYLLLGLVWVYLYALIELVEAKVAGRELLQPGTLEIAASPAVSLADALRASLEAQKAPVGAKNEVKAIGATSGEADEDAAPAADADGAKAAAKKPAKARQSKKAS